MYGSYSDIEIVISAVSVPGAIWLLGTTAIGLAGLRRNLHR